MGIKEKVVHEVRQTALVTAYFLVGFNLLALLFALLAPGFRSPVTLFTSATVAALVVGKVMVVADALVARRLSPTGSVLRIVTLKSLIFVVFVLLAMAAEEVVHGVVAEDLSWSASWHHFREAASWARFAARSVYLIVLFGLYNGIVELSRFLGTRNVFEIVTSKYRAPVPSDYWVLQAAWLDAPAPDRGEEAARLGRDLFVEIEDVVVKHGGELDLFTSRKGTILVPHSAHAARACVTIFADLEALVARQADAVRARLGIAPRLRAGVARGVLHVQELAGRHSRDFLRDGEALEQAVQLARANPDPTIVFAEDLGPALEAAGLSVEQRTLATPDGSITVWGLQ